MITVTRRGFLAAAGAGAVAATATGCGPKRRVLPGNELPADTLRWAWVDSWEALDIGTYCATHLETPHFACDVLRAGAAADIAGDRLTALQVGVLGGLPQWSPDPAAGYRAPEGYELVVCVFLPEVAWLEPAPRMWVQAGSRRLELWSDDHPWTKPDVLASWAVLLLVVAPVGEPALLCIKESERVARLDLRTGQALTDGADAWVGQTRRGTWDTSARPKIWFGDQRACKSPSSAFDMISGDVYLPLVSAAAVPWAAPVGWAGPGRTWLGIRLQAEWARSQDAELPFAWGDVVKVFAAGQPTRLVNDSATSVRDMAVRADRSPFELYFDAPADTRSLTLYGDVGPSLTLPAGATAWIEPARRHTVTWTRIDLG